MTCAHDNNYKKQYCHVLICFLVIQEELRDFTTKQNLQNQLIVKHEVYVRK
jgi:hypothetical protein